MPTIQHQAKKYKVTVVKLVFERNVKERIHKICNLKINSTKVKNQDKRIEYDDWGGWLLQIYWTRKSSPMK